MPSNKLDKTKIVILWVKEHFPLVSITNEGPASPDTEVWLSLKEGDKRAEIDLDRRSRKPPIETTDWFFSHALDPAPGTERVLIKARISDRDYFEKLRMALEAGGLTYKEQI